MSGPQAGNQHFGGTEMIARILKTGTTITAASMLLAACGSTDKVVFVTSTNISIGADPTTASFSIGYGRDELVAGPAYIDTGAMPPVIGSLKSNLQIFTPEIEQVYATGDAASILAGAKFDPTDNKNLTGVRRPMFFGTTSKIGLHVTFSNNYPTVDLGYRRRELSIIPLQPEDPKGNNAAGNPITDRYSSTFASISLAGDTKAPDSAGVKLNQFFATGKAAEWLVGNQTEVIQQIFINKANEALKLEGGQNAMKLKPK